MSDREFIEKVTTLLDESGVPYSIKPGSRHHKVRIGSRLVSVISYDKVKRASGRTELNHISRLKRAIREYKELHP